MKASPLLFLFLLLLWMGGSTWYYVCKIKHHCDGTMKIENKDKLISEEFSGSDVTGSDSLQMTKENILEDVKSKIENGYTVYNFPENSSKNEQIEVGFDEFTKNLSIYLNKNTNEKIEVTGHTDNIGTTEANILFGKQRALFIRDKLIQAGINKEQIIIKSKGKEEPSASNDTEEGRQENRRVVIKLIQN